jgi:hypothetical protein
MTDYGKSFTLQREEFNAEHAELAKRERGG